MRPREFSAKNSATSSMAARASSKLLGARWRSGNVARIKSAEWLPIDSEEVPGNRSRSQAAPSAPAVSTPVRKASVVALLTPANGLLDVSVNAPESIAR